MLKAVPCLLLLLGSSALAKAPRLTLFITVDALSADLLMRTLPRLSQGLKQLTVQGAYFVDARYDYSTLVTAAGHATLATGANPRRHGIVGNRIFNRQTGKSESAFADERYRPLEPCTETDVAPSQLMAETLSDRLRMSTYRRGKSVAVSVKARSAIALAGRLGTAWWFNDASGHFITSSYYAAELPQWVQSFNDRHLPQNYFNQSWTLVDPPSTYWGEDERPFEGEYLGLGRRFPHSLKGGTDQPGQKSNSALVYTPLMNDVLAQFALAAIHGEKLGNDDTPDLLSVSFSSTDYISHLFDPYSWEAQDGMIRLDRAIKELIAGAAAAAGGQANLLVVLTADHGGGASPADLQAMGMPGVRVTLNALERGLADELQRLGAGLLLSVEPGRVYLDQAAILSRKLEPLAVRRGAAAWLARQPEIAIALAADDLGTAFDSSGYLEAIKKGYQPERSGDVLFLLRPFHTLIEGVETASHGAPYGYDSQVPVIFWGKNVRPGLHQERIGVVDVAPTTAGLMEMSIPALAEGVPLAQIWAARAEQPRASPRIR